MNWETFYLTTFVIGFMLSLLSFLSSVIHIPHFHFHFHGHARGSGLSPFNFGTLAAFLAWFGGTGYLLERYSNMWMYLGLAISVMSGLGGGGLVFWFLVKLTPKGENLNPEDFEMVGVLGRVASPIRPGGTGELIYSRAGARSAAPARSENGTAISRDTEVIVTRYEKGIAYVRRWEEMSGERY